MNVTGNLVEAVRAAAARLGLKLKGELIADVRVYIDQRIDHLAAIAGEKGFAEAVEAERDNILLKAGLAAVDVADAADRELRGVLEGALSMGARLLAAGL